MNRMMARIAQIIVILALLASSLTLGSCGNKENTTIAPAEPISVDLSFPQGPPWLNQTAELRCVFRTAITADNVTMKITMPDGLQLVSGDLSAKFGTILRGDVRELKAIIKPVKVGNYTIEYLFSFVPRVGGMHGGTEIHKMYLAVSENSSESGIYPPWFPKPEAAPEALVEAVVAEILMLRPGKVVRPVEVVVAQVKPTAAISEGGSLQLSTDYVIAMWTYNGGILTSVAAEKFADLVEAAYSERNVVFSIVESDMAAGKFSLRVDYIIPGQLAGYGYIYEVRQENGKWLFRKVKRTFIS